MLLVVVGRLLGNVEVPVLARVAADARRVGPVAPVEAHVVVDERGSEFTNYDKCELTYYIFVLTEFSNKTLSQVN